MREDEKMVSDVVLANGLHKTEVIRFAQPVDVDAWVEKLVPDHSLDTWTYWDFVEDPKGLKLNHLYLYWRQRGPVDFTQIRQSLAEGTLDTLSVPVQGTHSNLLPQVGVLWWIAPGESLSFSADVAATVHKKKFGRMPSTAWVRALPKGAKDIQVGEGADQGKLVVKTGDWVPKRFVVVGIPG